MKREVWYIGKRKWYMLRDKKGHFAGLQLFKRAHGQDIRRKSKAEKKGKRK